jgi:hypothetical protein
MANALARISAIGRGVSADSVSFTLEYDRIEAQITLTAKDPLFEKEPANLQMFRVMLGRLGDAAVEAAGSPGGLLWLGHSDGT